MTALLATAGATHRHAAARHHAAAHHVAAAAPNDGGGIVALILVLVVIAVVVAWVVSASNRRSQKRVQAQSSRDDATRGWLAAIEAGNLPPVTPAGIMPIADETFFFEQRAQVGGTTTQRVYSGGNRAMYIPLGHGLRYRVGGNAGASQTVTNFMWGPFGTVYVSNRRVVFKPTDSTDISIAPYRQVLAYDCHPDGLSLQVERIGSLQFRTGDPVLGVLFQKIVTGQFQPRQQSAAT